MPGGRIHLNEFETPLEQIIRREVKEEVGEDVDFELILKPVGAGRVSSDRKQSPLGGPIHSFNIFFEANYKSGEIKISEEHLGFKWIKLENADLEKYFKFAILQGAKMYLDKIR